MSLTPAQQKIQMMFEQGLSKRRQMAQTQAEEQAQLPADNFAPPPVEPQAREHVDDWHARKWQTMREALDLTPSMEYLLDYVFWVACHYHENMGYSRAATQTEFFLEAKAVYWLIGMPHRTFYECISRLKQLGVLDLRGHIGSYKSCHRMDGSIWSVKFIPPQHKPARCSYEALKAEYVEPLEVRMKRSETVKQSVAQSKERPADTHQTKIELLSRALPPSSDNPSLNMTVQRDRVSALTSLLNVPHQPKGDPARNRAVHLFAKSAAAALDDPKSLKFYLRLGWNTLRLFDRGQDYFRAVYDVLNIVLTDKRESGKQKRPGALVVFELKKRGLYEAIFDAEWEGEHINKWRVGAPPSA